MRFHIFKVLISSLVFLLVASASYAYNYNYNTPQECNVAMQGYEKEAKALEDNADRNGNLSDAEMWFMTETFFNHISYRTSSTRESCSNGQCELKLDGNCGLINPKTSHLWINLITPIVDQQVNRLSTKTPDPQLMSHHGIAVTCKYNQNNMNYDNCTAQLL